MSGGGPQEAPSPRAGPANTPSQSAAARRRWHQLREHVKARRRAGQPPQAGAEPAGLAAVSLLALEKQKHQAVLQKLEKINLHHAKVEEELRQQLEQARTEIADLSVIAENTSHALMGQVAQNDAQSQIQRQLNTRAEAVAHARAPPRACDDAECNRKRAELNRRLTELQYELHRERAKKVALGQTVGTQTVLRGAEVYQPRRPQRLIASTSATSLGFDGGGGVIVGDDEAGEAEGAEQAPPQSQDAPEEGGEEGGDDEQGEDSQIQQLRVTVQALQATIGTLHTLKEAKAEGKVIEDRVAQAEVALVRARAQAQLMRAGLDKAKVPMIHRAVQATVEPDPVAMMLIPDDQPGSPSSLDSPGGLYRPGSLRFPNRIGSMRAARRDLSPEAGQDRLFRTVAIETRLVMSREEGRRALMQADWSQLLLEITGRSALRRALTGAATLLSAACQTPASWAGQRGPRQREPPKGGGTGMVGGWQAKEITAGVAMAMARTCVHLLDPVAAAQTVLRSGTDPSAGPRSPGITDGNSPPVPTTLSGHEERQDGGRQRHACPLPVSAFATAQGRQTGEHVTPVIGAGGGKGGSPQQAMLRSPAQTDNAQHLSPSPPPAATLGLLPPSGNSRRPRPQQQQQQQQQQQPPPNPEALQRVTSGNPRRPRPAGDTGTQSPPVGARWALAAQAERQAYQHSQSRHSDEHDRCGTGGVIPHSPHPQGAGLQGDQRGRSATSSEQSKACGAGSGVMLPQLPRSPRPDIVSQGRSIP